MTSTEPARHEPSGPEAIVEALKDEVHRRTAWDEEPGFGFIYGDGPGKVRLSELDVPAQIWRWAKSPVRMAEFFRRILATSDPRNRPLADLIRSAGRADLRGVFMRMEGWGPPRDKVEEIYRRHLAGGSVPPYEEMPGRVEFRICAAADAHGQRYVIMQERGAQEMDVQHDGMRGAQPGGDIPDTLRDIMTLMLTAPTDTKEPPATFRGGK